LLLRLANRLSKKFVHIILSTILNLNYDVRYPIPNNIFYDTEDGDAKHLKLAMLNTDPSLLSWVEFDAEKQILLALYVTKNI